MKSAQGAVNGAVALAVIGVEGHLNLNDAEVQMIDPSESIANEYEQRYKKYLGLSELMIKFTEKES